MPRIAVLISTRDREHLIGRAVRSVGRQTWRDFELLVGDDGCTDDTLAVVERAAADAGVAFRVVNGGGPHLGQCVMRNRLVRESDSEFVAILDDDDEFLPDRLAVGIRMMESVPDMAVTGGAAVFRDDKCDSKWIRRRPVTDLGIRRLAFGDCPFFHSSVLMRRTHLPPEPYDETMERAADALLWTRMTQREDLKFANTARATVVIHLHGGQVSREVLMRGERRFEERTTSLALEFLQRHGGPEDPAVAAWLAAPRKWTLDPALLVPDPGRARCAYDALDRGGRRIVGPSLAFAVERRTRWYVPPDLRGSASFVLRILAARGSRILGALARSARNAVAPPAAASRPHTTAMVVQTLARGGLERVVLDTAKGLRARGHGIEVLDVSAFRPLTGSELSPPVNVKVWRAYPGWFRRLVGLGRAFLQKSRDRAARRPWWHSGRVLRAVVWRLVREERSLRRACDLIWFGPRIRRKIARFAPHAILVHGGVLVPHFGNLLGSAGKTPPVVGVLHFFDGESRSLLQEWQRKRGRASSGDRTYPFRWAVVNPAIARPAAGVLKRDEREFFDLTNGIDTERIEGLARDAKLMAGRETILWAARCSPEKRPEDAVRAFALARERRPMKLLLLGEGSERERVRKLADATGFGADITLPGFTVPYADMAACGAFLLTSAHEGLPTVLLEALAVGTFCVSTDCPYGPKEILTDRRLGELVPVGDVEGLAEAMLGALDRREAENREAREFRMRYVRERFGLEASLDRYDRLVEALRAGTLPPGPDGP